MKTPHPIPTALALALAASLLLPALAATDHAEPAADTAHAAKAAKAARAAALDEPPAKGASAPAAIAPPDPIEQLRLRLLKSSRARAPPRPQAPTTCT